MLPVYICEDDAQIRKAQEEFLRKQILIEGYDMEIALCTGHPLAALQAVKASPRRGVCFLDVVLKGEKMKSGTVEPDIMLFCKKALYEIQ